jgi:hypothetical protein
LDSPPPTSSNFIKGFFLDTDGTPSIGSLLATVCLAFVLGWVTATVQYHIKSHIEPIIPDLTSSIALITCVMGVHRLGNYFENKNK